MGLTGTTPVAKQYFTAEERATALAAASREALSKAYLRPSRFEEPAPPRTPLAFWEWMMINGLTYRQAAEQFGVSMPTIYNWKTKGAPERILEQINAK